MRRALLSSRRSSAPALSASPNLLRTPFIQSRLYITSSFTQDDAIYERDFARSVEPATRDGFWLEASRRYVQWERPPKIGLHTPENEHVSRSTWFKDGELNLSFNCLDRHPKTSTALIYDSPYLGTKQKFTYGELLEQVQRFAGVLQNECGVKKGDRVVIYMPMIPEATIAMLACARLGAPHSVVFGGFAPKELAVRVMDSTPKCVVTASVGIEPNRVIEYGPILDEALRICAREKPSLATPVVVSKRRRNTETRTDLENGAVNSSFIDWDHAVARSEPVIQPVPVASTHPLYILYTSGTTGTPKGIVRDTGGYATALGLSMDRFMDVHAGDAYFCASDLGWVVGHSFILYGPLLAGATTVLYEGKPVGTPDAGAFWRVLEETQAKVLYTAPTALRAIRRADPDARAMKKRDLTHLKALLLAGERGDAETIKYFGSILPPKTRVVDNYWLTETGHPTCGYQSPKVGVVPGSTSKPCFGFNLTVLDPESGKPVPRNTMGMLTFKLPLPPGALTDVYLNPDRFHDSYMKAFPGYFSTGDFGFQDDNGYVTVMSRNDDLISVAGHRLSTGTIEQAIVGHEAVAEVAVIAPADELKGELPVALIVLHQADADKGESHAALIEKEVVTRVRDVVGPVASLHHVYVVAALPKTRSGKILRGVMKRIADADKEWLSKVPGTVEDVQVLHSIEKVLKERWAGRKK